MGILHDGRNHFTLIGCRSINILMDDLRMAARSTSVTNAVTMSRVPSNGRSTLRVTRGRIIYVLLDDLPTANRSTSITNADTTFRVPSDGHNHYALINPIDIRIKKWVHDTSSWRPSGVQVEYYVKFSVHADGHVQRVGRVFDVHCWVQWTKAKKNPCPNCRLLDILFSKPPGRVNWRPH